MNIDQLKERNIEDIEANSNEVDAMINDDVKATEENMARMINNLANQVQGDTGMKVSLIAVEREWVTTSDANGASCGEEFKVKLTLGTK